MLKTFIKYAIVEHAIDSFFDSVMRNFSHHKRMCYGSEITSNMNGLFVKIDNKYMRQNNCLPLTGMINIFDGGFIHLFNSSNQSLGLIEDYDEIYY